MAATGRRKKAKGAVFDIAKAQRNATTYAQTYYKDTNFHLSQLTQSEFEAASNAILQAMVNAYGEGFLAGVNDKGRGEESE